MIDYRGTEKKDLITSLKAAEAFLRGQNMGPAITQELNDWSAKSPYAALEAAKNREELAEAMQSTGSGSIFLRSHGVFQYHAIADTDGIGRQLYKDLCQWGCFSGMMTMDYKPSDGERQLHLVQQYAKRLREQEGRGASILRTAKALSRMTEEKLAETFLKSDLGGRYKIEETLSEALNLAEEGQKLQATGPFDRYGVVTDMPQDREAMRLAIAPVKKALEPFYKTGEVQMLGVGEFADDFSLTGVMFVATKAAAQAVADHLPLREVFNSKAEKIPPTPPAARPKPTPAAPKP